ncbi:MAG: ABC transporter substrate-binding protein [Candidatus Thorarchaeota archaeon]
MMLRIYTIVLVVNLLITTTFIPLSGATTENVPEPGVERIVMTKITAPDNLVSALISGDIDVFSGYVMLDYWDQLATAENVEVARYPFGLSRMLINCERYPLNITALRRAIALALDKNEIANTAPDGYCSIHDTVVPRGHPLSLENRLNETYYESDISRAQALLNDAAFLDINGDGILEAPDGSQFHLEVIVAMAFWVGAAFHSALEQLHINHTIVEGYIPDYWTRLWAGDYQLAILMTHEDRDIRSTMYHYTSASIPYDNPSRFVNATYEELYQRLLESPTLDEIVRISFEMQHLLWVECPVIVLYQSNGICAHRRDAFSGFVNDPFEGFGSWWSYMKVRPTSERHTLYTTIESTTCLFNPMTTGAPIVTSLLWDTLLAYGTENYVIPNLAQSWTIRTHATDASVPDGHMIVAFNLYDRSSDSEGTRIKALTVALSLMWQKSTMSTLNPYYVEKMVSAYPVSDYVVEVEFSTESFWNVIDIADTPIFSVSVLAELYTTSWTSWNPAGPDLVTTGPFRVQDGDTVVLVRNEYYSRPEAQAPDDGNSASGDGLWPYVVVIGAAVGVAIMTALLILRKRIPVRSSSQ